MVFSAKKLNTKMAVPISLFKSFQFLVVINKGSSDE